jgi:hypothetical protein
VKFLILASALFVHHAAFAENYMTCSRSADGYKYDILATLHTDWGQVANDDLRADGKLNVVRTGQAKAVRNYDAEYHLHKNERSISIFLSKRNTIYGDLRIHFSRNKIDRAILTLSDYRELSLDCQFVY